MKRRAAAALVVAALAAGACSSGGGGGGAGAKGGGAIVLGMVNQEDAPTGSFPEVRQAAQAAVAHVNDDLGGVAGRPLRLEVCTSYGMVRSEVSPP